MKIWLVVSLLVVVGLGYSMVAKKGALKTYRAKRDFSKTVEPAGRKKKAAGDEPLFVVQKHNASHLHYDFRLEIDGVLKSWAVPKGPSLDPAIKRLAVETEDHPMDYARFEGTIPQGEYGGGTVMVWDIGTFENIKSESLHDCYKRGTIEIALKGKKLRGAFALVRMNRPGKREWLLIKMHDEYAKPGHEIVKQRDTSALTKRTTDQIAAGKRKKG